MNQDECYIISIANQKGGVGKTTTTVNLATAMAAVGKKVLLIDMDPQANTSTGFGIHNKKSSLTTYGLMIGESNLSQMIVKTSIPGLSVIPSSVDLIGAEIELIHVKDREQILKNILTPYKGIFDYIFIDCPPSMGLLTLNALVASNHVIIPLQCEYYALEGLSYLLNSLSKINKKFNPDLNLFGVLLTMYDKRSSLSEVVAQDVRSHLKSKVFETVIPRNIKITEAPSYGKPVLIYDFKCAGSQAYMALAREILIKNMNRDNSIKVA